MLIVHVWLSKTGHSLASSEVSLSPSYDSLCDDSEPAYTAPQQGYRRERSWDRSRSRATGLSRGGGGGGGGGVVSRSRGRGLSRSRGRGCLEVAVGFFLEVEVGVV